jgi:hypothetical protein
MFGKVSQKNQERRSPWDLKLKEYMGEQAEGLL